LKPSAPVFVTNDSSFV